MKYVRVILSVALLLIILGVLIKIVSNLVLPFIIGVVVGACGVKYISDGDMKK